MKRRDFVKWTVASGIGIGLSSSAAGLGVDEKGKRIGIIGLDTSHSIAFTKIFNVDARVDLEGYRVVAAYPRGSKDIKLSVDRIPGYTKEIQEHGVKIVSSIEELLTLVDVVMLETNDGRLHLEQSIPVLKAGKRLFIDKPIAASLPDVVAIMDLAKQYKVPVFSSSSLRYFENASDLGQVGSITGADTFSPATLEPTHSDLFWYGIHGVELLYTILGAGCKTVQRTFTEGTDVVVGIWKDNRIGTFRGIRSGKKDYGGVAFGDKNLLTINPGKDYGYRSLMVKVAQFFRTGVSPVPLEEMLEIYTFMTAAEESSKKGGVPVSLEDTLKSVNKATGALKH